MRNTLRTLLTLLAATGLAAGLAACGGSDLKCGPGTTADGSECKVAKNGCTAGAQFDEKSGTCVANDKTCGEGASYDPKAEKCVPITKCGDGTENKGGTCVQKVAGICGGMDAPVQVNDKGECVLAEPACGEGTKLTAEGNCVPNDKACADGLNFDSESGTCVPSADVCDDGTKFVKDKGMCLPEATCQDGDKIVEVDGKPKCLDPVEAMAENADTTEAEATDNSANNDPATGGTPDSLSVKDQGKTTVFAGTVAKPSDLDGDGNPDQDVDVFKFQVQSAGWFEVGVKSNGLPSPWFVIKGPNGWSRHSSIGIEADQPNRAVALPGKGTYKIQVRPGAVRNKNVGPTGNSNWGYVGTLKKISTPSPTTVDVTKNNFSGTYNDLTDNLFKASGLSGNSVAQLTVESDSKQARGVISVWKNPSTKLAEFDIDSDTK
ncbi:MAG: hypothetical protein ABEL76_17565, partial [Bradymonadaceae bacterium]